MFGKTLELRRFFANKLPSGLAQMAFSVAVVALSLITVVTLATLSRGF